MAAPGINGARSSGTSLDSSLRTPTECEGDMPHVASFESGGSLYTSPPIFVVSSSIGYNAEQRVRIVLAQFPGCEDWPIAKVPHVTTAEQVNAAVRRAHSHGGIIVHTLISRELREEMAAAARQLGVTHVDLTGPLVEGMQEFLGCRCVEQPGAYWSTHREEFDRITAIEFTLKHDDGRRAEGWPLADMVLIGPSRSGKTPLSVYLGVMGYRVANVPLVSGPTGLQLPQELSKVDPRRVVGLNIDAEKLEKQRSSRQLGVRSTSYTDPMAIYEEVEEAARLYRRNGFHVVAVRDRAIEACAEEAVRLVTATNKVPRRSSTVALAELAAAEARG